MRTFENFIKKNLDINRNNGGIYIKTTPKELPKSINAEYDDIITDIKNYDIIHNFILNDKKYEVIITPDAGFIELISKLNKYLGDKISLDLYFDLSLVNLIDEEYPIRSMFNLIEFKNGIPVALIGLGVGYKIYKMMALNFKYLTSNKYASDLAQNVWYSLLQDKDFYAFSSKFDSGIILKSCNNEELKEFLGKIKLKNLIFDDEFKEKITEIYGSFENYKS